jgi:transcription initiation factor TFIID subunit TAF12
VKACDKAEQHQQQHSNEKKSSKSSSSSKQQQQQQKQQQQQQQQQRNVINRGRVYVTDFLRPYTTPEQSDCWQVLYERLAAYDYYEGRRIDEYINQNQY